MNAHRAGTVVPALALDGITRRFGSVVALRDVSLTVRPGTVHALLGENGAGKTTLMRIAYGMTHPDSGRIAIDGVARTFASPADAIAAGVGMVHQHFTLVPAMTVAENIALGGTGRYSARAAAHVVNEMAEATGFALDATARAESLGVGAQQRVEIAKALARRARVLVLDEPTGVLAPAEVTDLLRWLRRYVELGNSAVLITHKLREALAVADDVTVLRRGERVLAARAAEEDEESLTRAMIGAPLEHRVTSPRAATHRAGAPVIRAEDLAVRDEHGVVRVRDASFAIGAGEVVGIAGVEGSGQRELLRALAGRLPVSGGRLDRPDEVGFVPEDRHGEAMLLERDLAANVALHGLGRARGRIDWRAVRSRTRELMSAFDVRAHDDAAVAGTLSGGNQQKLVLARELAARGAPPEQQDTAGEPTDRHHPDAPPPIPAPAAIVVENPTRGLDVRATAAVHDRLREAAARGAAVIVYASDLDEVLMLATRVLVMFAGRVRETTLDRDAIGRALLGLDP